MTAVITGLSCPICSGTLSVREGQRIVKCPFCQARSLVRGERGIPRYQVPRQVEREAAAQAVRGFWQGFNRAMDLGRQAEITELFLVYLPYWRAHTHLAGWVFGQKKVGSGKNSRYEPREVKIMEPVEWTGAAGDVAEFGVERVRLDGTTFSAYDADAMHAEGMVFEPTGSQTAASEQAHEAWREHTRKKSKLDRVAQTTLCFLRETLALVYYPLWVGRYTYRRRVYPVVVDGRDGRVLYGKAPGNIYYRALALLAGTALGALLIVDGTALALALLSNSSDDDSGLALLLPIIAGSALIGLAYKLFRWGEEIEERGK